MKIIRLFLGKIILFLDAIFTPTAMIRSDSEQAKINEATQSMQLYELNMCPFCVKVRRSIKRLNLQIQLREIADDPKAHSELMAGGKIDQVPCLKIIENNKEKWIYESSEIITYLENQFS